MKKSIVIRSISDACSNGGGGGGGGGWGSGGSGGPRDLIQAMMRAGRDESIMRVNIARREFSMSLTFTSDVEILRVNSAAASYSRYPITSSPSITAPSLPMPQRMSGTSLATFKFGNGEAGASLELVRPIAIAI